MRGPTCQAAVASRTEDAAFFSAQQAVPFEILNAGSQSVWLYSASVQLLGNANAASSNVVSLMCALPLAFPCALFLVSLSRLVSPPAIPFAD